MPSEWSFNEYLSRQTIDANLNSVTKIHIYVNAMAEKLLVWKGAPYKPPNESIKWEVKLITNIF